MSKLFPLKGISYYAVTTNRILDVHTALSVQTYDFSVLYTSIPHNLLKSQIVTLVHSCFKRRDEGTGTPTLKLQVEKGISIFIDTINPRGDNL